MITRDRAAALVLLLFAVGGTLEASRLTIGDPGHPGPGFFPLCLALALVVVALALLLQPARMPPAPAAATEGLRPSRAALALLAALAYALALESIGFVVTTVAFLLFLLKVIEARGWPASLVIALSAAIVCHVVFKVWLAVQLPAGPWGF
jgi:putative tricarboxylic transport membrane protein